MSAGFPCPNPICNQVFAPDAITAAASLKCPACGTVFQFRRPSAGQATPAPPVAKKPTPPSPPMAKPVGKKPPPLPPVAAPVAPVAPMARVVEAEDFGERRPDTRLNFDSSPEVNLDERRRRRRRGGAGKLIVALFLILGLGGAGAYALYWVMTNAPPLHDDDNHPVTQKSQGNFTFVPPSSWKPDQKLQLDLKGGANLALTRKRPRAHLALAYRDYKTRSPTDSELLDEAVKKLRPYFATFEYENPFAEKDRGRSDTLGGEPAIVVPFQAKDREEVPMSGQIYMLTRQGYAYWVMTWGPEEYLDQLRPAWAALREKFTLHNERDGWKPSPRVSDNYSSPESGFQVNYARGLWIKEDRPQDYDEKCELALKGFEPTENPATGKPRVVALAGRLATVQVLVLPPAADAKAAYTAALEHIEKKQKAVYPNLKIEPVKDKAGNARVGVEVGAFRGQISYLSFELDTETKRYAVLAVASVGKVTVAVLCDCLFDRRDFWEQEFKELVETLRRSQGG